MRLHIPRTLRLIYDAGNKHDVAHLADGIDPNPRDATMAAWNMAWIQAELVRMHNKVPAVAAHRFIVDLVSKDVPLIQDFEGFPRVVRHLKASDRFLVLLSTIRSS